MGHPVLVGAEGGGRLETTEPGAVLQVLAEFIEQILTEDEILDAITRVHAKYDHLVGADLEAFEQRATYLKGLPPLRVDKLYVITEDDQIRDGKTVLFIGLKSDCVKSVFSFPTKFYRELTVSDAGA